MDKDWTAMLSLLGVIAKEMKGINGTLKLYVDSIKPKLNQTETNSLRKLEKEWENDPNTTPLGPETKEEIFMDLTEVTIEAQTNAAILVTKKGFQKWVPKSLIITPFDYNEIKKGKYLEFIKLTPVGNKWFHDKKAWEEYKIL